MRTFSKTIILLSLFVGTLASCNRGIPTPDADPIGRTETATSIGRIAIVETQIATLTVTPISITPTLTPPQPTPFFTFSVDRHNPESIIQAWFDALVRKDGVAMASVEGQSYLTYAFDEPIESIHVLEITPTSSSLPNQRNYTVLFEIQMEKGQEGHNFHNGQVRFNFTLTWDANRDSWFVTNHGY